MAVANQTNLGDTSRAPGAVGLLTEGEQPATNEYAIRAARILRTTKESAVNAFERGRRRAVRTYSQAIDKAQDLARHTRNRARYAKDEHPVELLAIAFGAAFVVGIALRIWRARAS